MREMIDHHEGGLDKFSCGYEKFGFQRRYNYGILAYDESRVHHSLP